MPASSTTCTILFCDDWREKHVGFVDNVVTRISLELSGGKSSDLIKVLHSPGLESHFNLDLPANYIVGPVEELIESYDIDILVTDLNFDHAGGNSARRHGFEIIEYARKALGGNIAVMLMTAYGDQYAEKIHGLGFNQDKHSFRVDYTDISSQRATEQEWEKLKSKLHTALNLVVPTI